MKKFKFRLDKVLQVRASLRKERLRDLMARTHELRQLENNLQYLSDEFLKNAIKENAILTIEELQRVGAYSERLKNEIANARVKILDAQNKVEEAMKAYVEASREEKALAMLKDRRYAEYLDLLSKEETSFLDELATQRFSSRAI